MRSKDAHKQLAQMSVKNVQLSFFLNKNLYLCNWASWVLFHFVPEGVSVSRTSANGHLPHNGHVLFPSPGGEGGDEVKGMINVPFRGKESWFGTTIAFQIENATVIVILT